MPAESSMVGEGELAVALADHAGQHGVDRLDQVVLRVGVDLGDPADGEEGERQDREEREERRSR